MTYPQPKFDEPDTPERRLEDLLSQGELPADVHAKGIRLLRRLQRPVQLVALGRAGSGKSTVVDVLLGQRVSSACSGMAMVEISHGETPSVSYDTATEAGQPLVGQFCDFPVPKDAICARQKLPHPLLQGLNITEVTLAGDNTQQASIVRHALAFADLVLWCSADFDHSEVTLWSHGGGGQVDRGFLVLTKADHQVMRDTLTLTLERLAPIAADGFLGLYPLAAEQALRACATREPLWRASGGERLSRDLQRRIAQGRRATVDQVEAFLWQVEPCGQPMCTDAQQLRTTLAAERAAVPQPPVSSNDGKNVLHQALERLQGKAEEMLADAGDTPQTALVLDQCLVAVRDMAETLLDAQSDAPEILAAQEAAQDGEEMLMLLQLEQDEEAAVDAVTLLLQLKKELKEPPKAVSQPHKVMP